MAAIDGGFKKIDESNITLEANFACQIGRGPTSCFKGNTATWNDLGCPFDVFEHFDKGSISKGTFELLIFELLWDHGRWMDSS